MPSASAARRPATSLSTARAKAAGSVPARLCLRAAARSASSPFPNVPRKSGDPLLQSGKAFREDAHVSPAAIRCSGSGRGPRRRGGFSTMALLCFPDSVGPRRREEAAEGGGPGRPCRRQTACGTPEPGHRLLHGLGKLRIGGQRCHLVLPEIDVAPRQILQRSEEHTSELQSLMPISYAVFCLKQQKKNRYKKV